MRQFTGQLANRLSPFDRAAQALTGLTPERVALIVAQANTSYNLAIRLFQTVTRDSEVKGAIQQRLNALIGGQWKWAISKDTRPRAAKKWATLTRVPGLLRAIRSLGWYSLFGMAAVEMIFDDVGEGRIVGFRRVPPAALDWREGSPHLNMKSGWVNLDEHPEIRRRLILMTADDNDPIFDAIMRAVAGPWIIKFFVVADWCVYSDRLGDPPTVANYKNNVVLPPDQTSKFDSVAEWLADLIDSLKNHSSIAIPEGVELMLLQDDRRDSAYAFDLLIDRCDRWMKRAILTSESTMQSGREGQGARSADMVRAEFGLDAVVLGDGELIAEAINRDMGGLLRELHGLPDACELSVTWRKEQPLNVQVDNISRLKTAGFSFDEDVALEDVGMIPKAPSRSGATEPEDDNEDDAPSDQDS